MSQAKVARLGLLGAQGRMGKEVSTLLAGEFSPRARLEVSIDRDSPASAWESLRGLDAVIDFSLPEAAIQMIESLLNSEGPLPALVIGSTGWTEEQQKLLDRAATRTFVLDSSNFSTGVLLVVELLKEYAPILKTLGYSPSILDVHHKHKKDAPSGTAIALRRAISSQAPSSVPTHSVRAGEVIGDHTVEFIGDADRIVIGHYAQNRSIFARGAIESALWLAEKRSEAARAPGSPLGARLGRLGMSDFLDSLRKKAGATD